MKTKSRNLIISFLLMIAMLLGVFAITPLTASAAAINAVWWTDASANTDFTASIDTAWVSSSGWYKLKKYNEASEKYVLVQGGYGCGYVGTNTLLDFETAIRQNGSGKYKVTIETKSGTTYESAEKTYTFEGALDAPQDLRWYGETAHWDSVEGADNYYVCLYYKREGDTSFKAWSSALLQSSKSSCDFTGQLSNPGSYYFTVEASSEDEMLVSSSAKSPEKTVSYTYSDLNAHWGDVSMDQRKYTLYWNNAPDATGYYMVLSKKNGEQYQPVSGFENRLKKITGLDLYAVMEANGEGDYKVDFFAFNTSPTIRVSNEVSIEITFTNCEHSYTKEIQESYYLHSASSDCTANTEYYYACEHCGEMAPKEAQYVYEGDIGEHDMSAGYQADGKIHWLACSKCDYAHYQNHTLDANNYCSVCDTTVYGVWLGDIQVTSKNCDDITGDGSAFYIPEQNRLFLTNYTDPDSRRVGITVIDPDSEYDYVAMIYAKNGLTLHLRGENFLYEDAGDIGRQYGVVIENGDLKIEGSGSLYANATVGFYTMDGDIYINKNGGLLDVVGYYAIRCEYHNLYINDGKVKLRSHAGNVYTSEPVLDDYGCYYAEISNDYGGADPEEYRPITNIKYFYIEPAYTVTIEPLGCEGDYITEVLRYGTEYTLPECPYTAPDGKAFYKWGVTPPGNMYEVGEKITITENVELTPLWQAIAPETLTATYSGTILAGNKITPENISITLTYNDSSTQPVNAGEVEYWYGGVQIADPVNYVFGAELIGDVNITVKYSGLETTMAVKVVGHEITFNANGGTGEMAKTEYVGEYTLPTCTFTEPTGKQFKGWATSADGAIIEATTYNVTENVQFFAIWEDIPSTPTTPITSISVSGADLPEVGETKDVMEFTPDSLTYGGEYKMVDRGFQKYTGTEWVDVSDTESLEYGVKYRVNLVLAPNEGYAFADSITSDDVTFNGKDAEFLGFVNAGTAKYAQIALEFSYEAPATDYGITIAKKNGTETVGVLITPENCTDVLGDGTVSYDPTTNTLTLNNYVYNGVGADDGDIGYYGLVADIPAEGLTIVLVGENSITVSGSESAGMILFGSGDLIIKGNGSLSINSGMFGITVQTDSGKLTIENAKFNITTTGARAIGVQANDFVMNSGNLKITASMIGIGTSEEEGIHINGGSVEIGTAIGGYAFIYRDSAHSTFNPVKPDLSNYVGDYNMTAGVNADGSEATEFNEGNLSSYKYVKVEPTHVHDHGTAWESDANEHWNECECGDKANKTAHSGGTATCQAKAKCEVCNAEYGELAACAGGTATCTEKAKCATCGNEYGELAPHNYNITNGYKGADGHANTCSCGAHDTPVAHTPDRTEATETDPIKCTVCGYIIEPVKGHVHAPKSEWKSDEDNHWHECTGCDGQQLEKAVHTDSDTNGACDVCGYTMPVSHTHDYGTIWKTDANNHWKECECGEKSENAAHIDGNGDNKCDTCDYAMPAHDPDDPGTTPPADNPPNDDDGGLGTGAIVGIVIGSVAVAGVGGFALFWFVIKKKTWADFLAIFKKK